jgi:hypothetical protein
MENIEPYCQSIRPEMKRKSFRFTKFVICLFKILYRLLTSQEDEEKKVLLSSMYFCHVINIFLTEVSIFRQ